VTRELPPTRVSAATGPRAGKAGGEASIWESEDRPRVACPGDRRGL